MLGSSGCHGALRSNNLCDSSLTIHGSSLACAGEFVHKADANGDDDGSEEGVQAAVDHFLDASGLESFPETPDAQRQAMTAELLGDLSLDDRAHSLLQQTGTTMSR